MKVVRDKPVKINRAKVEAASRRRTPGQRIIIPDADCRGLALVVHQTALTWVYSYKPRGIDPATCKRPATRSITIGSPETHSPDAARHAANEAKGQAKGGTDPAAARRAAIAAAASKRGRTVSRLVDAYAEALPTRPKLRGTGTISAAHAADETAHLKAAVTAMKAGGKPVADVGVADLRAMLTASANTPAAARHRYGSLARFFDWALDEGHIAVNPCLLLAKRWRPRPVAARANHHDPAGLARLWTAAEKAEELEPVHRDLIRFLVAVPCRRSEAAAMDWSHLDLAAAVWTQPGRMTKNDDLHRVHLHSLALGILRDRHRAAGEPTAGLVFPAPRSRRPVDTFSDMKKAVDATARLGDWRWHDMRRSFATALGEADALGEVIVSDAAADAVLNHRQAATRGGVAGVYQRARRWPEQVRAMTAWGQMLAAAIEAERRSQSPGSTRKVEGSARREMHRRK